MKVRLQSGKILTVKEKIVLQFNIHKISITLHFFGQFHGIEQCESVY